jgi:hypothetical protein
VGGARRPAPPPPLRSPCSGSTAEQQAAKWHSYSSTALLPPLPASRQRAPIWPRLTRPAPPRRALREAIQQESLAADDNLRCLSLLEEPCQRLAAATPQQIPGVLPAILNCIRAAWTYSRFYNKPHHIVGLLRKVRATGGCRPPHARGLRAPAVAPRAYSWAGGSLSCSPIGCA